MSRRAKSGRKVSGNPAKRASQSLADELAGQFVGDPTGVVDPRRLGGGMTSFGDSRSRGTTLIDPTDAVLLRDVDVATIDAVRAGELAEQAIFMTLGGRVNKSPDVVKVGFVFGPDGAAALITELLALADRFGAELLNDLVSRLTELHQGKHVDLLWLRAAIDVAMDGSE